jgi:hypothetical protein
VNHVSAGDRRIAGHDAAGMNFLHDQECLEGKKYRLVSTQPGHKGRHITEIHPLAFGMPFAASRAMDPIWSLALVLGALVPSFSLALALEWGLLALIVRAVGQDQRPDHRSPTKRR